MSLEGTESWCFYQHRPFPTAGSPKCRSQASGSNIRPQNSAQSICPSLIPGRPPCGSKDAQFAASARPARSYNFNPPVSGDLPEQRHVRCDRPCALKQNTTGQGRELHETIRWGRESRTAMDRQWGASAWRQGAVRPADEPNRGLQHVDCSPRVRTSRKCRRVRRIAALRLLYRRNRRPGEQTDRARRRFARRRPRDFDQ